MKTVILATLLLLSCSLQAQLGLDRYDAQRHMQSKLQEGARMSIEPHKVWYEYGGSYVEYVFSPDGFVDEVRHILYARRSSEIYMETMLEEFFFVTEEEGIEIYLEKVREAIMCWYYYDYDLRAHVFTFKSAADDI